MSSFKVPPPLPGVKPVVDPHHDSTAWESKFPTCVGGAVSVAISKPAFQQVSRGESPIAETRISRPVSRVSNQKGSPVKKHVSVQEALMAAIDAQNIRLDYSCGSIRPGSSLSDHTTNAHGHATSGKQLPVVHREEAFASNMPSHVRAVSASGYDRMQLAMERLHSRLCHLSMDNRWRVMSSWMNNFFDEVDIENMTEGVAKMMEMVEKETAGKPVPNAFSVATAMMLLEQILHVTMRSRPELRSAAIHIRDTLITAVYVEPPNLTSLNDSFQYLYELSDVQIQKRLVERYYGRTYFQKLRQISQRLASTQGHVDSAEIQKDKISKILQRVISFWQKYAMSRVLHSWREYIVSQKERNQYKQQLAERTNEIKQLNNRCEEAEAKSLQVSEWSARERTAMQQEMAKVRSEFAAERAKVAQLEDENTMLKERLRLAGLGGEE